MIAFLVACADPDGKEPVGADTADTEDTDDTADTEIRGLPEEAAWWEVPGPLDALLLPETIPDMAHWQLRIATRTDASSSWEPDPRVIALAFSSLSVFATDDRLVVTGNVDHGQASALEVIAPIGTVYTISTDDLSSWYSAGFFVTEATHGFVIDPSIYMGLDGEPGATWYATSKGGGDPATFPGDHEVRTGHWRGGVLVEDEGDATFGWPLLADPVICPLGDTSWLFATYDAGDILLASAAEGSAHTVVEDSLWPGPSVPSCRTVDDHVEVVVQTPRGDEPPQVARLDADGTFTEVGPLYDAHPWGSTNCTSPSITTWQGKEVLVCAVFIP